MAILTTNGKKSVACAKPGTTTYEKTYGELIPIKKLCECVASYGHLFTLYWWLSPFGSEFILGGYDRDRPQLYMIQPSGITYQYFGTIIGKGMQVAKTQIEKLKLFEMTSRGVIDFSKMTMGVLVLV